MQSRGKASPKSFSNVKRSSSRESRPSNDLTFSRGGKETGGARRRCRVVQEVEVEEEGKGVAVERRMEILH